MLSDPPKSRLNSENLMGSQGAWQFVAGNQVGCSGRFDRCGLYSRTGSSVRFGRLGRPRPPWSALPIRPPWLPRPLWPV